MRNMSKRRRKIYGRLCRLHERLECVRTEIVHKEHLVIETELVGVTPGS